MNVINRIFRGVAAPDNWCNEIKNDVGSIIQSARRKLRLSGLLSPVVKIVETINKDNSDSRRKIMAKYISYCQRKRQDANLFGNLYTAVLRANLMSKALRILEQIKTEVEGLKNDILQFKNKLEIVRKTYEESSLNGIFEKIKMAVSDLAAFASGKPEDTEINAKVEHINKSIVEPFNEVFKSNAKASAQSEFESNFLKKYKEFYSIQLRRSVAIQHLLLR